MTNDIKLAGPQICAIGVNYTRTPIAVREKLSIPRWQIQDALVSLRDYVPKGIILATCNRTEVYAIDDIDHSAEQAIYEFLKDRSGLSEYSLAPYLYIHHNYRAMRRLYKITSGLYSMILGEHEILGQVRQALEVAEKAQMVNLPLRRLFQQAISTGRRVRKETDISKNSLSISSVAVDLAAKVTGNIHDCRILVIGAGEAGKLVAKALSQRRVSQISVSSRSLVRAQELASMLGGKAIASSEKWDELATSDIVISCSGSPHFVIHYDQVKEATLNRSARPLVIVDIAVPRDVEPEVKQIEGVFLYDIDDLNNTLGMNREDREGEVDKAMAIINSDLEHLLEWWQSLEAKPTVSALMQMAESIRQQQLNLTLKKLPPLSQEEHDSLEAMTKSIINKILHNPIQCLNENGHQEESFIRIARDLFALDKEAS